MNDSIKKEVIPVGRAKDIIGERFGKLVVVGRVANIKSDTAWLCECDCGNRKVIRTTSLRSGDVKSCGCKKRTHDIKGNKFGRLTAIELTERRSSSGDAYWKCKCECGNFTEVRKSKLSSGNTKSCGCLARELSSKRGKERVVNLRGQKFGRLSVIKDTGKRTGEGAIWHCHCECGGTIETSGRSLMGKRATSCGCKQIEHIRKVGLSNVGENNPAYNHDLTDKQRETDLFHRTSHQAKEARVQTLERDNYTCRACNTSAGDKVAHHLEGFAENLDLRFDIDNLITLCVDCHLDFHKKYGFGNNTKEQFEEYCNTIKSDNVIENTQKTLA